MLWRTDSQDGEMLDRQGEQIGNRKQMEIITSVSVFPLTQRGLWARCTSVPIAFIKESIHLLAELGPCLITPVALFFPFFTFFHTDIYKNDG